MNGTLAVISQTGQTLSFFDLTTGARTGQLEGLTAEPHELCFDDRTDLLYITHAYRHGWYGEHGDDGTEISVVDCKSREVVGVLDTSPGRGVHYCLLDKGNNILYACVEGGLAGDEPRAGGIVGVDLGTKKVVKAIRSGWKSHWFVMTPDCRKAFTCNKDADFISVIDLIDEQLVTKIEMPGGCEQPSISKDGTLAFFPTPGMGVSMSGRETVFSIKVVDTVLDQIVRSIPMELGGLTTHVDSQDRLLVGQYRFDFPKSAPPVPLDGRLLILSGEAQSFDVLGSVDVGKAPLTLFSSSDGRKAYVANQWSGTVTVVDISSTTVDRTLDVDTVRPAEKAMLNGAHGLAIVP